ncbi:hypothetical protein, partial [Isoptericola sp. NPDC057191]|uniref:hypothetical protein n=1 Tax=Isoptericola sp. NPDC057191 TaxID=3346041 RepID=UPI003645EBDA
GIPDGIPAVFVPTTPAGLVPVDERRVGRRAGARVQPMARRPSIPRDALPLEPFVVRDALAAGLPRHRLRGADVDAPFHGVRTASRPLDLAERCRALLPVLDASCAFSHGTALRLWGVEVPWTIERDDRLHVVTPDETARLRRAGIVAHRSRQSFLDTTILDGVPVTTAAQTFVHVAVGLRRPDDVVVLGDAMMRRQQPFTTAAELRTISERTHKVKGIAQVRTLIEQMRPGTDSTPETRTRLALVDARLPCPEVNGIVLAPDGTYIKRIDLLYRQLQIAIEYDGDQHRTDKAQWREDVRARRRLEELGWIVIVVVADDLRDPGALAARVRAAFRSRRSI